MSSLLLLLLLQGGQTALHWASGNEYVEIVRTLVDMGADLNITDNVSNDDIDDHDDYDNGSDDDDDNNYECC